METNKMFNLDKFCCICMNKSDLKHLFEVDSDGVSHYNKLTSSIAEMNFKEMNDQRLICAECYVTLNTVYNFRQMCLKNKTNLINYITYLQQFRNVGGTVKGEMEIKCEKEDNSHCLLQIKNNPVVFFSCLNKFCCICLCDKADFKPIYDVDKDGVSQYNKLTSSIAEMDFEEMNDQRFICGECCITLNTVYNFRQMCLSRKPNIISQLQTSDHTSGTFRVCLKDIKPELIVVTNRGGSENEASNCLEGSNPQIKFQTESSVENIYLSTSVKEECESEDDDSSAREDATVDHVNEGAHSDVKVEDVQHLPMMEDYSEYYMEFNKIEIEENQLKEVKGEPMSDIETPQDGSTSQADTGTSEDPKRSEKVAIGSELAQNTENDKEGLHRSGIRQKSYNGHMKKQSSERPYECEICKTGFNYKRNLTEHMKTHSSKRLYECEICKDRFSRQSNLTAHMPLHSRKRPYKCEICKKGYNYKCSLTEHMKKHSSERSYECEICKKRFSRKSNLTAHMPLHSSKRPYECEICKKAFNYKCSLTEHMKKQCSKRPYECEICKKGYTYNCNLTEHMKTHSSERSYECEICKKHFSSKSNLTSHMPLHSSKRPYECEICKKGYNYKCSLTEHMKKHSGKRPYECEICEKSYNYKSNLTEHMRTHSSERPYECEICKISYKFKSRLTVHMKTHSNKRPYECEICKKGYNYKSHLTEHMKIHSSKRPYECEICKKDYNYKSSLTEHIKTHSSER